MKRHRKPQQVLRHSLLIGLGFALPTVVATPTWGQTTKPALPAPTARSIPTPELKGRRVEEVQILGNTTVAYNIIRNLIRTQVGDKFDPATVQDDYQRVFDLKKFANVEARVEPTKTGGVIIVIVVTEQKLIKSITYHGNRAFTAEILKGVIELKDGQAIDTFRINLARQAILNKYRDDNFPMARVEVASDKLSTTGELVFDIVEGPQVRIRNIDFIGVRSFTKGRIAEQIHTSSYVFIFNGGKYDPELVDEDVAGIRRFYEGKGFFDVRVDRKLIFSPDNTELEVDYIIDEGRRYSINRIIFEGNSRLSEAVLTKNFHLAAGMNWDQEVVDRDKKLIVAAYSPLGFIYAPTSTDEDYLRIDAKPIYLKDPGKVDLVFSIHEGKPFKLGAIYVRGNHRSQDKLVVREFRDMGPGQLYNSAGVQDATERLRATPIFTGITVNPIGDDPVYRDILVELNEARTASFSVGGGINSNGGVGGNFTYRQQNFDITNFPDDIRDTFSDRAFTGGGQQFIASFEPGTIATNASLRFIEPYLFDQPYSFSEDLYLRDRIYESYTESRLGERVSIGKNFDYNTSLSLSLRGEEVKIAKVYDERFRSEQILAAEGTTPLTAAGVTFHWNNTNPGFLPYRGMNFVAGYEHAGVLGGDYNFSRLTTNIDGYQMLYDDVLDRKTVLGLHVSSGYIPDHAPFFERFYGGGIGSTRGFRFRGISPRDGRGEDPIGGNFFLNGTAEVNFPIFADNLRGVVFADAGDVEKEAHLGTIRTSVGFGIRLTLPFLGQTPIAIDFGIPITKGHEDGTQLISFSLGAFQ